MCQCAPKNEADLPDWLADHIDDPPLLSVVAQGGWRYAATFYRGLFIKASQREADLKEDLASMILGMLSKRVANDWEKVYGIRPGLVETFVDSERFAGTCYKAANWICVGQTKGRGKYDRRHQKKSPIKDVWTYPLRRNPAQFLKSTRLR